MAEEFQESDIAFSEVHCLAPRRRDSRNSPSQGYNKCAGEKTAPVSIPGRIFRIDESEDDEMEFDDGEVTPPHVIVGRRLARKMAFSVCSGSGRTLKGRDLKQFRTSILRLTGFLEA